MFQYSIGGAVMLNAITDGHDCMFLSLTDHNNQIFQSGSYAGIPVYWIIKHVIFWGFFKRQLWAELERCDCCQATVSQTLLHEEHSFIVYLHYIRELLLGYCVWDTNLSNSEKIGYCGYVSCHV